MRVENNLTLELISKAVNRLEGNLSTIQKAAEFADKLTKEDLTSHDGALICDGKWSARHSLIAYIVSK